MCVSDKISLFSDLLLKVLEYPNCGPHDQPCWDIVWYLYWYSLHICGGIAYIRMNANEIVVLLTNISWIFGCMQHHEEEAEVGKEN